MSRLVLVIDDEPDIRELLQITVQRMGLECVCARNLGAARKLLTENTVDLCLTDMRLPDGDGVGFIKEIQQQFPNLPTAVISAHGSMDTAIQALKNGAFDFVTKPIDLAQLRILIGNAIKLPAAVPHPDTELAGQCQPIRELKNTIDKLSRSQAPVYISGESGTGKELVARMIHDRGTRASSLFVPVNCGAIPHDLVESEFFGHKKGSFTGATSDKEGLFQTAHNGTLFLDEIADLPPGIQVKLLRAIQEKKIRPVGSQQEIAVDVRILSATHKNLSGLVAAGVFRQDLFYRINVIEVNVPPLRERGEDIALLIDHIVNKLRQVNGLPEVNIEDDARQQLMRYRFPGNVRELENILERAITLSDGITITREDITLPGYEAPDSPGGPGENIDDLDSYLIDIEKEKIINALEKNKWNKTATARQLGMSFRALRYRLGKLKIDS